MHLKTMLTTKAIRAEALNHTVYTRGEEYFRKHRVKQVKLWQDDHEERLTAAIKGKSEDFYETEASIELDTGDIMDFSCTCPAYAENSMGACKHIVALLLHRYFYTDSHSYELADSFSIKDIEIRENVEKPLFFDWSKDNRNAGSVHTDPRIKTLINRYVIDDVAKTTVDGDVRVVPKLELYEGIAYLNLTIGSTRQYIVKNIESFCNNIKTHSKVEYGKELELIHHLDAFEAESKQLVRFILRKQHERDLYINRGSFVYGYGMTYSYNGISGGYGPEKDKKSLKLMPSGIDELFDLRLGKDTAVGVYGINYKGYGGSISTSKMARFEERKLKFYIEIKELSQQKGFTLSLPDCEYVIGEKYLYLYCNDKSKFGKEQGLSDVFCRCDPDLSRTMRELVLAGISSKQPLNISNRDMVSFYVNVLAELKNHVEIRGDVDKIRRFAPDDMQVSIYLDSPQNDRITASVKFQYGDMEIDPYDPQSQKKYDIIARDEKKERRVNLALNKYFKQYNSQNNQLVIVGDDDQIYEFVTEGFTEIAKLGQVYATDRFRNMGIKRPPQISVGVRLESDLLNINLDFKDFPLAEAMDVLDHYKQKRRFYRMKDGSFLKLDNIGFSELADMVDSLGLSQKDLAAGQVSVPKYRAMYLDHLLKNSDYVTFERNGHFKSLIRNMKSIDDSDYTVPRSLELIMREYQKDGYRWLNTMDNIGFGGILADDMGLGKTLQMISLLLSKKLSGEDCSTLVVCPTSLILNWQNEIQKFAPELKVLPVMGLQSERKALLKDMDQYDVLITSYDLLKRDIDRYREKNFRYQIIDEAQYIKNQGTQNAKAVKAIKSRQRFALTGTPVENRLSELWSIFDFLMPAYLYTYKKFKETYETPIVKSGDQDRMERLRKQVSPFMLRRLKSNVLKELPEKVETVVYAQMEDEQKKLYLANLAKTKLEINKNINEKGFEASKIAILALLTRLRQICCHPALCYEDYKSESAKLEVCIELLTEAISSGHKVLLFSQFTSMLDIIENRLKKEGISCFMLTGSTSKEKRMELVDRFNTNGTQVFLISLKAGGTGLNLTGADVVIHYDPWWNIAAQNQATDRTHRIGQKNSVQVYKLIEKGTVEEKILKLQENKRDLADAIVTDENSGMGSLSREALMELLQY